MEAQFLGPLMVGLREDGGQPHLNLPPHPRGASGETGRGRAERGRAGVVLYQ